MQLFVDMDGVLVDFDLGYEKTFGEPPSWQSVGWETHKSDKWQLIQSKPKFFRTLPPMSDAFVLWQAVSWLHPTILTGVPPELPDVAEEKRQWVAEHLGDVPFISCLSEDKHMHGSPGSVLIDDREKCGDPWVAMGGIWIKHKNAKDSIAQLRDLLKI